MIVTKVAKGRLVFDYEVNVCLLETRCFVYTIVCSWDGGAGKKVGVMA